MASAANRTITGVVISGEDNEPLIGASVYVHTDELKKNGSSEVSLGTVTDIDGKFSLSIPEKTTRIHAAISDLRNKSYYCKQERMTIASYFNLPHIHWEMLSSPVIRK